MDLNNNYNSTEKLNSLLKKFVIVFGVSLILLTIILFIIYSLSKNNKPTTVVENIPYKEMKISKSCKNIEFIYKDNFTIVNYKDCRTLAIINNATGETKQQDY